LVFIVEILEPLIYFSVIIIFQTVSVGFVWSVGGGVGLSLNSVGVCDELLLNPADI